MNIYQMFSMPNDLEVILIQDNNQQELEKGEPIAYCAFAVNAESFNDPPHRYGLALFLEHMIFMGIEQFPKEDAFSSHISENGGFCNAFTEFEKTCFTFDINYSGLERTLEMMACNFSQPLMLKDAVDREINAIESEFQM